MSPLSIRRVRREGQLLIPRQERAPTASIFQMSQTHGADSVSEGSRAPQRMSIQSR